MSIEEIIEELKKIAYEGVEIKQEELHKFTDDEKTILINLPKEYKWLSRDEDGMLYISIDKPIKNIGYWSMDDNVSFGMFDHIFQTIQWEDEEPCEFRKYLGEE